MSFSMETLKTLPKETQCSPGSLWLPGLGLGSRQLQMGSQLAPTQSLPLLVLKTRQDPLRLSHSGPSCYWHLYKTWGQVHPVLANVSACTNSSSAGSQGNTKHCWDQNLTDIPGKRLKNHLIIPNIICTFSISG